MSDYHWLGFPGGSDGKDSACNVGDLGSIPGFRRSPGDGNPLQYSCLENPNGQRNLVGYSPWGCKESDMTEWLITAILLKYYLSTAKFGKLQWPQVLKKSVFIPIPKKGNAKECSNYCTIALISQASKVMLSILQARLQQYVNCELPDVQTGFRKGRGTRGQIANIHWIIEKAREKTYISALLTLPKPLTVWTQ